MKLTTLMLTGSSETPKSRWIFVYLHLYKNQANEFWLLESRRDCSSRRRHEQGVLRRFCFSMEVLVTCRVTQ